MNFYVQFAIFEAVSWIVLLVISGIVLPKKKMDEKD